MDRHDRSITAPARRRRTRGSLDPQHLLIGGLVLVIALSALGAWLTFRGDDVESLDSGLRFHCAKCGEEFSREAEDLPADALDAAMTDQYGMRLDCPACNAPKSCVRMKRCPNCKAHYVAASVGGDATAPNVCPKCNTDELEWLKSQGKG